MSAEWNKQGIIFEPNGSLSWMKKYAWVPTAYNYSGDLYRIYCSGRNENNLSTTGFFEIDINNPSEILCVSEDPVIELGPLGSFDDSLAVGCSIVRVGELIYFYYVGWMQGSRVRYYPSIGLAISRDNGRSFSKYSQAPIIDRSNEEPFGMASPFVMFDDGKWRMWYASYRKWEIRNGEPWPKYEIRYAESEDGINWKLAGITCIGSEDQEAVARPWIRKEGNTYRMWFSYRDNFQNYRIGYAESVNCLTWTRLPNLVGIDVSDTGWDSEMLEYPCVISHKDREYMFYNGNNFGEHGVGLAIRKREVKNVYLP